MLRKRLINKNSLIPKGAAIAFCFLVFTISTKSNLLFEPRFWAEEATIYYAEALDLGWRSIFLVANGNFQILTNLGAYLASLTPTIYAPYVTTGFALFFEFLVVVFFIKLLEEGKFRFEGSFLIAIFWAMAVPRYETGLTTTNVQWTCAVITLLLLLTDGYMSKYAQFLVYLLIILCGLTGVPSLIMLPAFFIVAFLQKSRFHFICGILLTACLFIHVPIILLSDHSGRSFMVGLKLLFSPMFLQTAVVPLAGIQIGDLIGDALRAGGDVSRGAFAGAAGIFFFYFIVCIFCASSATHFSHVFCLASIWIGAAIVQTLGALGDPIGLISAAGGARYYLTSLFSSVLLLALGTASDKRGTRILSTSALFVLVAMAFLQPKVDNSLSSFLTGPSWSAQIRACESSNCEVTVWPGGAWRIIVPNPHPPGAV